MTTYRTEKFDISYWRHVSENRGPPVMELQKVAVSFSYFVFEYFRRKCFWVSHHRPSENFLNEKKQRPNIPETIPAKYLGRLKIQSEVLDTNHDITRH